MSQPTLFTKTPFKGEADAVMSKVRQSVELLTSASFASATPAQVGTQLYNLYHMDALALHLEDAFQRPPVDIMIDVVDENTSVGRRLAQGVRFSFYIPYTGSQAQLLTKPTGASTSPPFGTVPGPEINFTLEHPATANVEDLATLYQTNTSHLSSYTTLLNQDIDAFNTDLQQALNTMVTNRKAQLDKKYSDAEVFGVPVIA